MDAGAEKVDVLTGECGGRERSRVQHHQLARRGEDGIQRHQEKDGVDAVVPDQRGERARDAGDRHPADVSGAAG